MFRQIKSGQVERALRALRLQVEAILEDSPHAFVAHCAMF